MRIQTILNRVEKFESFVYGAARLEGPLGWSGPGGSDAATEELSLLLFWVWPYWSDV